MKIHVNYLSGAALDYVVALIQELPVKFDPMGFKRESLGGYWVWDDTYPPKYGHMQIGVKYSPSQNWSQGGPIIENIKGFEFKHRLESKPELSCEAHIHDYDGDSIYFGPTLLVAAMRCLVAHKLGGEIEIPNYFKTK